MSIHQFYKSSLIYKTCTEIIQQKEKKLRGLVAYSNDPIRYNRRIRFLLQLSEYETAILKKLENFDSDSPEDLNDITWDKIKREIDSIARIDS